MELAKEIKVFYNPDKLEEEKVEPNLVNVEHLTDPTIDDLIIEICKCKCIGLNIIDIFVTCVSS